MNSFLADPFPLIFSAIIVFLALSWWFWAFIILLPTAISAWLHWRREKFKSELTWAILELKMPREIKKNPRAMEQVLTAIHAMRNAWGDLAELWWEGEVTRWYSLEIVSFGGEVHFYVRLYRAQKALMEAAFMSYYPDIEVEEVEDYVNRFPKTTAEMYAQGYGIWGAEMQLDKEEAYPIKTYIEFESPAEEKQYDTMSAYLEVLSKTRREEISCIQFLIAPASSNWRDKWDYLIEKLRARQAEAAAAKVKTAAAFPGGPLPKLEAVKPDQRSDGSLFIRSFMRTPGETEVLEAVENNLSKPAFATLIRFVYLSPKTMYSDTYPRRGISGIFKQFTALDLNSISRNEITATRVKLWAPGGVRLFPKRRLKYREERILLNYLKREVPPENFMGRLITSYLFNWNFVSRTYMINTECLATLFHPPTYIALTAPHVKRVESRKFGPPAGTAVYGEEEEIERFQ